MTGTITIDGIIFVSRSIIVLLVTHFAPNNSGSFAETVLGLDRAYLGEKALRPLLGVEQPVPSTNGFMSSRP
jgi:hypothetical protein